MSQQALKDLAKQYYLDVQQLRELFNLIEQDRSAPYILRYRKDLAANLDSDDIANLRRECRRLEKLDRERSKILAKLEKQGVLTDELKEEIDNASTLYQLIDLYVPFRPRKHSRSRLALAQGLSPLAQSVITHEEPVEMMAEVAEDYIDPEAGIEDIGEVLDGVFHIICDWIAEEKNHRETQRQILWKHGNLVSRKTGRWNREWQNEFGNYASFNEPVSNVHPYHMLCMMNGKRLNALKYRVEPPYSTMYHQAAELYLEGGSEEFDQIHTQFQGQDSPPQHEELGDLRSAEFLYWCIRSSLSDILAPILARELERQLRSKAEDLAIDIVRRDLKSQLLTKPVTGKNVLGISPGFRTGCKIAAVDKDGQILECDVIYPHTPRYRTEEAKNTLVSLVKKHDIGLFALNDGTASSETETLLSDLIASECPDLKYVIVDSTPGEAYAGTPQTRQDCDGKDQKFHSAIFAARQIIDPLRELTKIPPKKLCSVQYIAEIDKITKEIEMDKAVEECVAEIGPDLNSAPRNLLTYVPGLNATSVREILKWRAQEGAFNSREQLREVPKIDEQTWDKAAGFVRITDSENPLDNTRIHPRHYPMAMAMLQQADYSLEELKDQDKSKKLWEQRGKIQFADLEKEYDVHYLTLKEILNELCDPWSDPRENNQEPFFRQKQLSFEDLEPFQMLEGKVRKVVDFGAFVDVGVGEDGLVHVSEISENYVQSPYDVICVGERVRVWIIDVNPNQRRIALSMRSKKAAQEAAEKRKRTEERDRQRKEEQERKQQAAREAAQKVSDIELPPSIEQPNSPRQARNRRLEKLREFSKQKMDDMAAGKSKKRSASSEQNREEQDRQAHAEEDTGGLLEKLEFASVEKRGEQKN
jgi:uncharacterized protein